MLNLKAIVDHHREINNVNFDLDTITKDFIDTMWDKSDKEFKTEIIGNKPTTSAYVTLPNGFTLIEHSSCVKPENYDFKMGKEACEERIKTQMWKLYGFFLQEILHY